MYGETKQDTFRDIAANIETNSPYQKRAPAPKAMMSVKEMGDLLGLKKTERYWLIHKQYFKTETVMGQLRVDLESFESWYANQLGYHKITGEEPGSELKKNYLSPGDICDLLALDEGSVYELIRKNQMETIKADRRTMVRKESFYHWYSSQSRYRTKQDRMQDAPVEHATLSMPEAARLLGVPRETLYSILQSRQYHTLFEFLEIADRKRITKRSFEHFLALQKSYRLDPAADYTPAAPDDNRAIADFLRTKVAEKASVRSLTTGPKIPSEDSALPSPHSPDYLTQDEAAAMANVKRCTVSSWCSKGYFTVIRVGKTVRILRKEYENWLNNR